MTNEKAERTWETPAWIAEGKQTIRYGILSNLFMDWGFLLKEVLFIEELGYDTACIFDHPTSLGASDCWATLAMLAVATRRIRLLSLVSCASYRHTVVLARMAADVERASKGRLVLGSGMGDDQSEFKLLGLPFPSRRECQEKLEETVQIIQGLWPRADFTCFLLYKRPSRAVSIHCLNLVENTCTPGSSSIAR